MKRSKLLVIALPILFLFQQCKKKHIVNEQHQNFFEITDWWQGEPSNVAADTTTETKFPQYVKDYMKFKMGSYWVYEEENSGALDSVYVIHEPFDGFYVRTNPDRYGKLRFEEIETYVKSSYYNCYYTYYCFSLYSEFPKGVYHHQILRDKRDSSNNSVNLDDNPACLILPFKEGMKVYSGPTINPTYINDSIMSIKFYQEYKSFAKVALTFASKNYNENEPTAYYFSKNVGLIRLEYLSSNIKWQLIRFHIVQ
jgi:hypothetical protein